MSAVVLAEHFHELELDDDLLAVLDKQGFDAPFPIQSMTLPDALAGRDICGKAPTGSGKTLAFGLATVQRVHKGKPGRPSALILAPTRELATQIRDELVPLARTRKMTCRAFYGGTGITRDFQALDKGVDIAVCTPGRLEDLIDRNAISLGDVEIVVIDEADRMADMGFLPVVKRLLDQTSEDRQTLLFSATLDGDVDVLVKRYQHKPAKFELDPPDDHGDVQHLFVRTTSNLRVELAADVLAGFESAIVFCRTKHGTDRLARQLKKLGISSEAIHGNRSQGQRERALKAFSSGKVRALCATDVAARGIHVDNVECVLHFDPPGTDKDYVHRSGRTGRAGASGIVISLVVKEKAKDVQAMQRQLGMEVGFDELDLTGFQTRDRTPIVDAKPSKQAEQGRSGGKGRSTGGGRAKGGPKGKSDRYEKSDRYDKKSGPKSKTQSKPKRDRRDDDWYDDDRPSRPKRSGQGGGGPKSGGSKKSGQKRTSTPRQPKPGDESARSWRRARGETTREGADGVVDWYPPGEGPRQKREDRPKRKRTHKPKPAPKGRRKPQSQAAKAQKKAARKSSQGGQRPDGSGQGARKQSGGKADSRSKAKRNPKGRHRER